MSNEFLRECRREVRALEQRGWTVEYLGSGHLRFIRPDGTIAWHESNTPGRMDRARERLRARLRREGIDPHQLTNRKDQR